MLPDRPGTPLAVPGRAIFVESYPQGMFGQQKLLLELLRRWPAERPRPLIAAPAPGAFTAQAEAEGHDVRLFPYPPALAGYGGSILRRRGWRRLRAGAEAAAYGARLRAALRRLDARGVFCNDTRGLLTFGAAGKSLGLPVMFWDKLDASLGALDHCKLPLCDRAVLINRAVAGKYPLWQRRLYARRLVELPLRVDLSPCFDAPRGAREELGLPPQATVFGIVGSITHRKGHDRIWEVWPAVREALPDARLLVVGSVPDDARAYRAALPELPGIRFLGFRDDIPALLRALDVLLVPSRREGQGLVIAEAGACGVPTIGARVGGIPFAIGPGGRLFEDRRRLRMHMLDLGRDPALRAELGKHARERAVRLFHLGPRSAVADLFGELIEARG